MSSLRALRPVPLLFGLFLFGGCQSYETGVEVICQAPKRCTECMEAPPDRQSAKLAQHIEKLLRNGEARKLLDKAVEGTRKGDKFLHAWTLLHRGILELDTGHHQDAKTYFERANQTFSGWSLIEEHLAEVTTGIYTAFGTADMLKLKVGE